MKAGPIEKRFRLILGFRLNMLRRQTKLSRRKFGDLLGVHRNTIERWEKGDLAPSIWNAIEICSVLGISIRQLTGGLLNETEKENSSVLTARSYSEHTEIRA